MNDNYVIHDGQLYHHGIKGMKWGIRRFQKPDGSLTPAGKKRYDDGEGDTWKARREAKRLKRAQDKINNAYRKKRVEDMTPEELKAATERAKLEREHRAVRPDTWKTESEAKAEARAKRAGEKTGKSVHKKSVDDMTTDELKEAIERAKLEDTYRALRPPEVSRGKQFVESMKNMAATVAVDEGKKLLGKLGDRILDKYFPSMKKDLDTLQKEAVLDKTRAEAAEKWASIRSKNNTDTNPTNKSANKPNDDSNDKTNDDSNDKTNVKSAPEKPTSNSGSASQSKPRDSEPSKTSSESKKETYYPDAIYDAPKTKSSSSTKKTYDTIIIDDYVDKSSNQSTSVVVRESSNITAGRDYASNYTGLTVSELIRKQWDD